MVSSSTAVNGGNDHHHAAPPKRHVVCIPYPAQGHLNPMLKLAKLLHSTGRFHITYVNTEYNHRRLLKSRAAAFLDDLPVDFRFATIPDGLPPSEFDDATQDIPALCQSTKNTCTAPFRDLLLRLNEEAAAGGKIPAVGYVISDACMSFTLDAAEELGIPEVVFWTPSACGVLGYANYRRLIRDGLVPLKDEKELTNGYLNTPVTGIPAMEGIQLKDFPNFIRTTDPDDGMLNFLIREIDRTSRARAVIFNTFRPFESTFLDSLTSAAAFPPIYPIGPLQLMVEQLASDSLTSITSNLWKEDTECLNWLDTKPPNSVVYVNFGSITVMTRDQMVEFAWGLANSEKPFLWVIRPDLVRGESAMLPAEFAAETENRGLLASWCRQEEVLKHPAIGGFLSHMGWNSTLESVSCGVPLVCWPFFAEQQTNCWSACEVWRVGMEIDSDVKRGDVEGLVRELMDGEKGKEMKRKAVEWKGMAEVATADGGGSRRSFEALVELLLQGK